MINILIHFYISQNYEIYFRNSITIIIIFFYYFSTRFIYTEFVSSIYFFMKFFLSKLKNFGTEIIIILGFIFIANYFLGEVDKPIQSDGLGYYDYLPSIFIYHDLIRKNDPIQDNPNLYQRVIKTGVYSDHHQYKVNKFAVGTALLQLPFFSVALLSSDLEGNSNDGYQKPFQKAVLISTLFYLFLSIFFLKKILLLYDIKKYLIIICQIFLVFGTLATNYSHFDAGFSHVYSFFAITAFLYFVKLFCLHKKSSHFLLASIFIGLVFILRQANILIILFMPFIAGSFSEIRESFKSLFNRYKTILLGIVLFMGVVSIQLLMWYLQTGSLVVYSYHGEQFNFLDPHFFSILFSYKKGLFIYTPILLITLLSLIWFIYKKQYYLFFTWMTFFVMITYVLSSWWSWFYGCGFGLRAYIDYYPVFFIPFAMMLTELNNTPRIIILALSFLMIPLNLIQSYQYRYNILHWIDMDKEKYWQVFLKTDARYSGLVWRNDIDKNMYTPVYEINAGDICLPKKNEAVVFSVDCSKIPEFEQVSIVQVIMEHDFEEHDDSRVVVAIHNRNKTKTYYWYERYLIHFNQKGLNKWQTGFFNFEFTPISDLESKELFIFLKTGNQADYLKNVRLRFLKNKNQE